MEPVLWNSHTLHVSCGAVFKSILITDTSKKDIFQKNILGLKNVYNR